MVRARIRPPAPLWLVCPSTTSFAQAIVLENSQLRWEIDVQARTVGLTGKATGRDYAAKPPRAVAFITLGGKRSVQASRARRGGDDMSFALMQADEEYTGHISQALGNSSLAGDVWHWDRRGGGNKCKPGTGLRLIRAKTKRVTFRIYPREGHGARDNPRLDLLCITALPDYVPTDENASTR